MKASLSTSSSESRGQAGGPTTERRRKLIGVAFFLALSVASLFALGEWMENRFQRDGENGFAFIYEEPDIDLFFVGSSQFYFAVNPWVLHEVAEVNPFGITSSGQKFDSAYYLLENALKVHNPDVVVIDVYWRLLEQKFDFSQADFNLSRVVDEQIAQDFYRDGFPFSAKLRYSIKLLRYRDSLYTQGEAVMNNVIDRLSLRPTADPHPAADQPAALAELAAELPNESSSVSEEAIVTFNRQRGFRTSDNVVSRKELEEDNKFANYYFRGFAARQEEFLVRMLERCREEGITAVMVSTPIPDESLAHVEDYPQIHRSLETIADVYDAYFFDFNALLESRRSFSREHFQDDNHLNTAGSVLFTRELIRLLEAEGIL